MYILLSRVSAVTKRGKTCQEIIMIMTIIRTLLFCLQRELIWRAVYYIGYLQGLLQQRLLPTE